MLDFLELVAVSRGADEEHFPCLIREIRAVLIPGVRVSCMAGIVQSSSARRLLGRRKLEGDRGSVARLGLDRDAALAGFDDSADDGEAVSACSHHPCRG
jgi:hypothetical protein